MLKNFINKQIIVFFTILLSFNLSAKVNNTLEHNDLLQELINYIEKKANPNSLDNIKITALPLDGRLKFTKCHSGLHFEIANRKKLIRQFPVKVSCNDENQRWKTYAQVIVTELQKVLILSRGVVKGMRIEPDMLKMVVIDKHKVKSRSIEDASAIVGGRAMRNIAQGYQIGQKDVCLVCKGDDVSIIAKSSSMMIKTSGIAIEDGAKGESIKVKNSSSQRIIKGTIGDLREVFVNL